MFKANICKTKEISLGRSEAQSLADVLQNRCAEKFRKFHSKTPVLESLFNKVQGFRSATLSKRDSNTGVFL